MTKRMTIAALMLAAPMLGAPPAARAAGGDPCAGQPCVELARRSEDLQRAIGLMLYWIERFECRFLDGEEEREECRAAAARMADYDEAVQTALEAVRAPR